MLKLWENLGIRKLTNAPVRKRNCVVHVHAQTCIEGDEKSYRILTVLFYYYYNSKIITKDTLNNKNSAEQKNNIDLHVEY